MTRNEESRRLVVPTSQSGKEEQCTDSHIIDDLGAIADGSRHLAGEIADEAWRDPSAMEYMYAWAATDAWMAYRYGLSALAMLIAMKRLPTTADETGSEATL